MPAQNPAPQELPPLPTLADHEMIPPEEKAPRNPAESQEFKLQLPNSTFASLSNYSTQKFAWAYEQTKSLVNRATSYLAYAKIGTKK